MEVKKETIWREVGKRLKKLRLELKYSKKQMAQRLGINLNSYYKNENGNSFPWLYSLYRLHKDFGISMDWLIFDYGPMYLKEKEPGKPSEEELAKQLAIKAEEVKEAEQEEVKKPWWEQSMPDARGLLEYMAQDPLFRYKVFLFFYEYKEKKEKDEMKNEDQELSTESALPSTNEAQSRRNKK
jgi:transcriptional regulator with XRE-family HTH domain